MRFGSTVLFSALCCSIALTALASPHARRGPTSPHFANKKSSLPRKPVAQRGIDPERITQIQTALISQGYLTGTPSGTWTPETQDALRKLQSDNGWPTKTIPDSRAIIKLGLGPGSSVPESSIVATAPSANQPEPLDSEPSIPVQR